MIIYDYKDAKHLYTDFKRVKEDIETSIINGEQIMKKDVQWLLAIAETAVENTMFEWEP